MKIALRVAWLIISFLFVEIVVFLPLFLLGLVVFPVAYHFAGIKVTESRVNKGQYILAFRNRVLNEWLGNHEDGLLPGWWQKERNGSAYGWFLRNPVSNMRFWPYVSTLPSPETKWVGTLDRVENEPGWFFAWAGAYSGFCWNGKRLGLWVGWKINAIDRRIGTLDAPPKDYRYYGLGLACMIWRNR